MSLLPEKKQKVGSFSGGMKRRLSLAIAAVGNPKIILLDEPTTFLDYVAKEELMETLRRLSENKGPGILFTSHDLDIIGKHAQHKLELKNGSISVIN